jgi:hypothetical protein
MISGRRNEFHWLMPSMMAAVANTGPLSGSMMLQKMRG